MSADEFFLLTAKVKLTKPSGGRIKEIHVMGSGWSRPYQTKQSQVWHTMIYHWMSRWMGTPKSLATLHTIQTSSIVGRNSVSTSQPPFKNTNPKT